VSWLSGTVAHEILVQRITKAKFTNHAIMQVARILLFLSQIAALDSNQRDDIF
jgi:hypothetical protein